MTAAVPTLRVLRAARELITPDGHAWALAVLDEAIARLVAAGAPE